MANDSTPWPVWQRHLVWLAGLSFVLLPLFPLPPLIYLSVMLTYYSSRGLKNAVQRRIIARNRQSIGKLFLPAIIIGLATPIFVPPNTLPLPSNSLSGFQRFGIDSCAVAIAAFMVLWVVDLFIPLPIDFMGWLRRRRDQRQLEAQRAAAELQHQSQQTAQHAAASLQASEQQRRVEARSQCELLYGLYAKEIAERFPKSMLDSFMQTYMNDSQPVDAVERRGKELQRILQQHHDAERPSKKFHTIQELAQWFVDEKQRIEGLPIDDELRQEHLVQLNMRYSDLTQEMLQKIEP